MAEAPASLQAILDQVAWLKKRLSIDDARFADLVKRNKMWPHTREYELGMTRAVLHTLEGLLPQDVLPEPKRHSGSFTHHGESFEQARARLAANPPPPEEHVEPY